MCAAVAQRLHDLSQRVARASGLLSTRVPHAAAIDFDVGAALGTRSNWRHQPSAFYGVNSRELSDWTKDTRGTNAGMR